MNKAINPDAKHDANLTLVDFKSVTKRLQYGLSGRRRASKAQMDGGIQLAANLPFKSSTRQ